MVKATDNTSDVFSGLANTGGSFGSTGVNIDGANKKTISVL